MRTLPILLAFLLSPVLLVVCFFLWNFLIWRTVYEVRQPGGLRSVELQARNCFADCAARVVVRTWWRAWQIAEASDCSFSFAHADWSGDVVAIYIDDALCGGSKIAYDTESNRQREFESVRPWLARSIELQYRVTPQELRSNEGDVFLWASHADKTGGRRAYQDFYNRVFDRSSARK